MCAHQQQQQQNLCIESGAIKSGLSLLIIRIFICVHVSTERTFQCCPLFIGNLFISLCRRRRFFSFPFLRSLSHSSHLLLYIMHNYVGSFSCTFTRTPKWEVVSLVLMLFFAQIWCTEESTSRLINSLTRPIVIAFAISFFVVQWFSFTFSYLERIERSTKNLIILAFFQRSQTEKTKPHN